MGNFRPTHYFSNKAGSAAIILSLMVSGAVLSTIFHSQKNINWFISKTELSKEDWEAHLTVKYGFTLGGYLVANNLVLCKETGWKDTTALCKWNTSDSTVQLQDYNLSSPVLTKVAGKDTLTMAGQIKNEPTLNNGEPLNYTIQFDLVNWKDSYIKTLIGDIPTSVCRNKKTLKVIPGKCVSPHQDKCIDDKNAPINNSVCEYIKEADQDFYIVLISVKSEGKNQVAHHAGIRRPLAHVIVTLESSAKCELTCAASDTGQRYPECRGEFVPPSGQDYSTLRMKLINKGPGSIYSLSMLREQVSRLEKDQHGNPLKFYQVTDNLLEREDKEVIHPGESFIVQDKVTCMDEVQYKITSQTITTTRRGNPRVTSTTTSSGSVNVHAQSFMSLSYTLGSLTTPIGICVESSADADGNRKQIPGTCNNQYSVNTPCGSGGVCLYPHIEPRRVFYPKMLEKSVTLKGTVTVKSFDFLTTIVRYISPH
ncbi:MAG: hypothetical protein OXM55_08510 [Bdellovibrionales bacterium]|nr:hypothetical protein [Bdellovibrionales bacterium]